MDTTQSSVCDFVVHYNHKMEDGSVVPMLLHMRFRKDEEHCKDLRTRTDEIYFSEEFQGEARAAAARGTPTLPRKFDAPHSTFMAPIL